ncbi:hypothetical protein QF117_19175 [Vibrio sp. YMD68]|uniref:hypothetical protein n=1 Tax=Vibrio sp. YMD68 TaxID=3042300 RepID=UPI00249C57D2|nr:hypothetical protein [Vibrio sp. YMD68]WGV99992.1 hypothetical protein QF117_19175 [Vibrio sp. YMD68]
MYKNKYSDKKMSLYIELIHQYELELEEEGREDFRDFIIEQIEKLNKSKRYLENWTIGD